MKRLRSLIAFLLVAGLAAAAAVAGASQLTYKGYPVAHVELDGAAVSSDVPAIVVDGRVLLPVRALAEALDLDVQWDAAAGVARLSTRPGAPALPVVAVAIEDAPASVQQWLAAQGYAAGQEVFTIDGQRYLAVTAGERPTGGYTMQVVAAAELDGVLHLTIAVIAPPPDAIVTQAFTNPALVVRLPGDLPVAVDLVNR